MRVHATRQAIGVITATFLMVVSMPPAISFAAANIITNCQQLQSMGQNLSADYVLSNNVDCNGVTFTPIGDHANPFTGTLDGQSFQIKNLHIDIGSNNYAGLFGQINGPGIIKNLTITDADVSGQGDVGILAGYVNGIYQGPAAQIINVHVSGNVNGGGQSNSTSASYIGGLVGALYQGSIENSSATAALATQYAGQVGGLVGNASYSTISDSTTAGSITDIAPIGSSAGPYGGLVGTMYSTPLTNDNSSVNIHSASAYDVGGLVGNSTGMSAYSKVYATGNVSGNSFLGGLIGWSDNGDTIDQAYATGTISNIDAGSGYDIGGLIGYAIGSSSYPTTISNVYSTGTVYVDNGNYEADTGGLIGYFNNVTLSNSYTTSNIASSSNAIGGFIGETVGGGTVQDSYASNNFPPTMTANHQAAFTGIEGGYNTSPVAYQRNYYDAGRSGQTLCNVDSPQFCAANIIEAVNITNDDSQYFTSSTSRRPFVDANGAAVWDFTNVWILTNGMIQLRFHLASPYISHNATSSGLNEQVASVDISQKPSGVTHKTLLSGMSLIRESENTVSDSNEQDTTNNPSSTETSTKYNERPKPIAASTTANNKVKLYIGLAAPAVLLLLLIIIIRRRRNA